MAIRGIDFTAKRGSASKQPEAIPQSVRAAKDHLGKQPANSFTSDQHSDLHADYVMARTRRSRMTSTARTQLDWLPAEPKRDQS